MEYILINESKLKVTLEESDLDELDLSTEELDYANPEAKQFFGDILGYAKEELGFDTSGHRVLLQLYPSKDGGCEIFITRLGKLDGQSEKKESDKRIKDLTKERKKESRRRKAFKFEKLSHLVEACKRLCEIQPDVSGEIFSDPEGKWFLLLYICENDYSEVLDMLPVNELSFLCEYGSAEDLRSLSLYLGEYGVPIAAKNPIEAISRL